MYIPGRQRQLIKLLLQADKELTVKEIANKLKVSQRTIHRDLKDVDTLLSAYQLKLVRKTGVGLQLIGTKKQRRQLEYMLGRSAPADFTSEERQTLILATLLETNEPVKMFTLADELHVTTATVSHDLTQIEDMLSHFRLHLIRRRGYGVKLTGSEGDKRAALSRLITENLNPFDYVLLLKENILKQPNEQSNIIFNRLLGLVNPEDLQVIEQRVSKTRDMLPYAIADSAYIGLVVHLALAIERLKKGDTITFDTDYLQQFVSTSEYQLAKHMIDDLKKALNMAIPYDEVGYITMHLLGAKLRTNQYGTDPSDDMHITLKAQSLIDYIGKHFNVDLTENMTLLHDLIAHLKPSIFRLQQNMDISNPLLAEIKADYPDLFSLVREGAHHIFPELNFPEDEIGYLVLHFAVVLFHNEGTLDLKALVICSSGIGTAKILGEKLKQNIPEIKQVENISMFDLNDINWESYDLIVSTVLLQSFEGHYILASPMLPDADIHRVKKAVMQRQLVGQSNPIREVKVRTEKRINSVKMFTNQLKTMQNYTATVLDLLQGFCVKTLPCVDTLIGALNHIGDHLKGENILTNTESILNKLLEREALGGLGIPESSLALYHTRSEDISKSHFSVYRLREPLLVTGMDGESTQINTLLMMLAPTAMHQEGLEVLSYLSQMIIQDETSLTLFETGNEYNIQNFISNQFKQFLLNKNLLS